MASERIPDRYLGDGVYASFDGYYMILDLRAQDESRIAIEPQVWDALRQFASDINQFYNVKHFGVYK